MILKLFLVCAFYLSSFVKLPVVYQVLLACTRYQVVHTAVATAAVMVLYGSKVVVIRPSSIIDEYLYQVCSE